MYSSQVGDTKHNILIIFDDMYSFQVGDTKHSILITLALDEEY